MTTKRELARGALWRQWDLHVHTPASFHWLGQKFDADLSSTDGWFALKQRLARVTCSIKRVRDVADSDCDDLR